MGELQDFWQRFRAAADTLSVVGAVEDVTGLAPEFQSALVRSVVIILVLVAARWLALRAIRHNVEDLRSRYRWRKTATYIAVGLGIFLVGRVWFAGFRDLTTLFGFIGAGLAIALREPISNMAGWAFILWRRPFSVGDRIQIGGDAGDVIDLRLFAFTLLEIGNWVDADQSTGRVIHVPNGKVFTDPIGNYTQGFQYIWNEIPVLVTFESDWRKAKEILQRIADEHGASLDEDARRRVLEASRRFMIFYSTLSPTVYTRIADSGVLLTVRYLSDPRNRRGSAQAIQEAILRAFAEHDDIDFAYPTQRFYANFVEGKPFTRTPVRGLDVGPLPGAEKGGAE